MSIFKVSTQNQFLLPCVIDQIIDVGYKSDYWCRLLIQLLVWVIGQIIGVLF